MDRSDATGLVPAEGEQPSISRDVLAELAARLEQRKEQMFEYLREAPREREYLLNRTDHLIYDLRCAGIAARNAYANMDEWLFEYANLTDGPKDISTEDRPGIIIDAILHADAHADSFELGCEYQQSMWGQRTRVYEDVRNARYDGAYIAEILDVMSVLPPSVTADNLWSHINQARTGITKRGPGDPWRGSERGIEVISRMSEDGKHHNGDVAIITAPDFGLRLYVPLQYDGRTGECIAGSGGFGLQLTRDRFMELSLNPERKRVITPAPPSVMYNKL